MANQLVTKVTNDTSKDIKLNEGNAGLWRFIYLIKSKKSYVIHIDPNATYREYWCATDKDDPNNKVTLGTDDCQENKEAVIEEVTDGSGVPFKIRFIPRSELPRETGFLSSLVNRIFSVFPTGNPQTVVL